MDFRSATETDIPQIVDLLRLSLGDAGTRKSDRYWRWKHLENPFGRSPVLLAESEGKLVGVRAFMRWSWKSGNDIYSALRPVDTATHPDYQRRGIFKRLTLALVDQCSREGDHLLFNTPNDQSRPGYLKMGWQAWGKLPIQIRPWSIWKPRHKLPDHFASQFPLSPLLSQFLLEVDSSYAKGWQTAMSMKYLKWRFQECPVKPYGGIGDQKNLILFTLQQRKQGLELRIVEMLGNDPKLLRKAINELAKAFRPFMISLSPHTPKLGSFLPSLAIGPMLTVRPLNNFQVPPLKAWTFSLGDMELF